MKTTVNEGKEYQSILPESKSLKNHSFFDIIPIPLLVLFLTSLNTLTAYF